MYSLLHLTLHFPSRSIRWPQVPRFLSQIPVTVSIMILRTRHWCRTIISTIKNKSMLFTLTITARLASSSLCSWACVWNTPVLPVFLSRRIRRTSTIIPVCSLHSISYIHPMSRMRWTLVCPIAFPALHRIWWTLSRSIRTSIPMLVERKTWSRVIRIMPNWDIHSRIISISLPFILIRTMYSFRL